MTDLMRYAAALEGLEWGALPPVESWRPERVGEIDIVIKADGAWVHKGAPIERARLVRLFSTILRRDGEDYFLVTPAEKLKIRVEDAPFLAVLMETAYSGARREITFTTNLGERVSADRDHAIRLRSGPGGDEVPYIEVRRGLEARIARSVYYDLVALAERRHMGNEDVYGVWSCGEFFKFGAIGPDGD